MILTGEQVREAADKDHEEGGAVVKLEGGALDDDGPQVAKVTLDESWTDLHMTLLVIGMTNPLDLIFTLGTGCRRQRCRRGGEPR